MANVIRWDPFQDTVSLRDAMDRLFEESFVHPLGREAGNGNRAASLPVDLYETPEAVMVKTRLPGVNPEDVEVNVHGDTLTIKAELRSDAALDEAKNWAWHRHELYHGTVARSITLPTLIQPDKVEATFRNGELSLVLPKAEEVKPRSIKVKTVAR
jgi:HSP20 family protein